MQVKYRLDNIQTESHPILIHTAGLVSFMKSLKYNCYLISRNRISFILHRDVHFILFLPDLNSQHAWRFCEFSCVVQKIVNDLCNRIHIAANHKIFFRHGYIHVQPAVCYFLLKAEQCYAYSLDDIERLRKDRLRISLLNSGCIEHPAHKSGQALCFSRYHLQIMPLLFRRDSPVKDAVCKAGNGRHGRFQFVGYV